MLTIFGWNFEIEERCKGVHCVDLAESFPTSSYLQKSASIQPRTIPPNFWGKFNLLFIRLLSDDGASKPGSSASKPPVALRGVPRCAPSTWAELMSEIDPDRWWYQNGPCMHAFSVKFSRILTDVRKSLKILTDSREVREILRKLHKHWCENREFA